MTRDPDRVGGKTCIALGGVLIVVGVTLLALAYFGVKDPTWQFRSRFGSFDKVDYGYFIELVRLLLVVPLAMLALGMGFSRTLTWLLSIHQWSTWTWPATICRLLLFGIAILYGGWYAGKCFDTSEDSYCTKHIAFGHEKECYTSEKAALQLAQLDKQIASARLAYGLYAGYAAIFYATLLPLLVVVPAYAFVSEDLPRVRAARRFMVESVERRLSAAKIERRFRRFRNAMTRLATRHVRLLAAVGIAVAFEQYLGSLAMSAEAQSDVRVALAVVGANALVLLVALYFYYDGWQTANRYLIEQGHAQTLAEDQYAPQGYVKYLLKYNYSAYIVASLLATPLVASPWRTQVEKLLQWIG